ISIGKGAHLEIQDKEVLPYKLVRNLGHGASASVELVLDQNTKKVYARKVFKNVYGRTLKDVKQHFRNEIRIMRRLSSGHHVVNLYATYLAGRELALILDPAADGGDLAEFMQGYDDLQQELSDSRKHSGTVHSNGSDLHQIVQLERRRIEMLTTLKRAFGCLASGLEFIHKQTIRHKDIKPQNILIHQGNVLYTDFGFSLDHSTRGRSTTTGRPNAFTRRYCAPEVADHDRRNSTSDIFSLGCVYAEITATLYPGLIPER
ncbi:kinase-like protein, partial [Paraphaeosphaeria sporulosa]